MNAHQEIITKFLTSPNGEVLWVTGKSGSGKTTLAKEVLGKFPQDKQLYVADIRDFLWRYATEANSDPVIAASWFDEYDVVAFDDVDVSVLNEGEKTQETFRMFLERIAESEGKIICCSSQNMAGIFDSKCLWLEL